MLPLPPSSSTSSSSSSKSTGHNPSGSATATTPSSAVPSHPANPVLHNSRPVPTAPSNPHPVNPHPIIAVPPVPFGGGRDLIHKMKTLRSQLNAMQPQTGHCRIEVSRRNVFEDSYRTIMKIRARDLKKKLHIKFQGEDGLDYGGIAREWLYLLSHEMLNPIYGLFQYSRDDVYTLQINPDSAINPVSLWKFFFFYLFLFLSFFFPLTWSVWTI